MSVSSELSRIQTARNTIRSTLVSWGEASESDTLDDLALAVSGIPNRGSVNVSISDHENYTIPKGYHDGTGTVLNVATGGIIEPLIYDYRKGYVDRGVWKHEDPTNTFVDIYEAISGHTYFNVYGGTMGTRYRAMFTTVDVTQTTENVTGTQIINTNNPAKYANFTYKAPEDGYILVAKDNVGASGLKTFMYDAESVWA